ncbi:MAG: peptide deformylase [Candidatus Cryosericum sp.]|jgi:peptide deformylase|nr:peptide deformylase [Candidatus Cryosericum sp.]HPS69757.1 peptide deformylase [Candidatus Cryosericum sp.]
MKIVLIGSPVLRKKAKPIRKMTGDFVDLAMSMEALMKPNGVGLAGPQVGLELAFFIYDVGDGLRLVANPQILDHKGTATNEEGCLSIPGIWAPIERAEQITLSYLDRSGKRRIREFSGLEARVIQHETDHLQGKLFIDHIADPSTITVEEGSPVAEILAQTIEARAAAS